MTREGDPPGRPYNEMAGRKRAHTKVHPLHLRIPAFAGMTGAGKSESKVGQTERKNDPFRLQLGEDLRKFKTFAY
jgi:hypothetical protein